MSSRPAPRARGGSFEGSRGRAGARGGILKGVQRAQYDRDADPLCKQVAADSSIHMGHRQLC